MGTTADSFHDAGLMRTGDQTPLGVTREPVSDAAAKLRPARPGRSTPAPQRRWRSHRIARRDVYAFTVQLAIMSRAGVDLASALQTLMRQCRSPRLKTTLEHIYKDVTEGRTVSEALRRHNDVFGPSFVASVAAGEASGRLPDVLDQLARLQKSELRLRATLRTILGYPVVLAIVSSFVLMGLTFFVLPQFGEIFREFETPLPMITRVLLGVSGQLESRLWLYGPVALAFLIASVLFVRSRVGQRWWDHFVLRFSLLRHVAQSLMIGRSFRLLGIMVASGVPLLESLRLVRASIRNAVFRQLFVDLEEGVLAGAGMSGTLAAADIVPDAAAEMLMTAERTGSLAQVMQLIGEHFEEEAESQMRALVGILEPLVIALMGVVVALVVLAVMLPMFDLATLAQHTP